MQELQKINWEYNFQDGPLFINDERKFNESATFRIINGTFRNPFISDLDDDRHQFELKKMKKNIQSIKSKSHSQNNKHGNYVPGVSSIPLFPKRSILSKQQHMTCLKVLQYLNQSCISMPKVNITQDELSMYNALLPNIKDEQILFNNHLKNLWKTKLCTRALHILESHNKFIENLWKNNLIAAKKYPPFYQMATMLPLVYTNETNSIDLELLETLEINVENDPFIVYPNLERIYKLPQSCEKISEKHHTYDKLFSVSEDERCKELAINHRADIVISYDSLKHLANNYPPFTRIWHLPVIVREYEVINPKGKPTKHCVTYIDHALPPRKLTVREKTHWCFELLLKDILIKSGHKNTSEEVPKTTDDKSNPNVSCDKCQKNDLKDDVTSEDSDDEDQLIIDIDYPQLSPNSSKFTGMITRGMRNRLDQSPQNKQVESVKKELKKRKASSMSNESKTCSCKKKSHNEEVDKTKENNAKTNRKDDNPYTYNLWKLGQTEQESKLSKTAERHLLILVRNKADGSIENLEKCFVEPKLEYQIEYGSECITPSEAAIQWTSLQFLPNSKLLRVKVLVHSLEVVMIEKFSLHTMLSEITKQPVWRPKMGLGCFFNVFSSLCRLHAGNYMLSHEDKYGSFAMLHSSVPNRQENGLDLYQVYDDVNPSVIEINQTASWNPIDQTIATPNLVHNKIMPCMFSPDAKLFRKPHQKETNMKTSKKNIKNYKKGNKKKNKKFR